MTDSPGLEDLGLAPLAEDSLSSTHAQRLAHMLDLVDDPLTDGLLPITWIWAFFSPLTSTAELRADGHPAGRTDGPLAGLDRRMFIGGSLERRGELRLDTQTERASSVLDAQNKHGRTGPFVLVDVEHQYSQRGAVVLVERQQLMYRTAPTEPVAAPGATAPQDIVSDHSRVIRPDERLLFRYSAITFNTHRIHYDLPYASQVEGYPGLVVHGPLTATLLASLAAETLGRELSTFSFRATSPTYAHVTLRLTAERTPEGQATLHALRDDGVIVMTARGY